MQRASSRHGGPLTRSHMSPSAAAAVHVPAAVAVDPVHVPWVLQSTVWSSMTLVPHGAPLAAALIVAHCFVAVLHVRRLLWSHAGPVLLSGSHMAPSVVIDAWHVPV